MTEFDQLMRAGTWRPIANCPGRYTLVGEARPALLATLLADPTRTRETTVATARDRVAVTRLIGGGGLISYRRADGTELCTLNTESGFTRKLTQLGIPAPRT